MLIEHKKDIEYSHEQIAQLNKDVNNLNDVVDALAQGK